MGSEEDSMKTKVVAEAEAAQEEETKEQEDSITEVVKEATKEETSEEEVETGTATTMAEACTTGDQTTEGAMTEEDLEAVLMAEAREIFLLGL